MAVATNSLENNSLGLITFAGSTLALDSLRKIKGNSVLSIIPSYGSVALRLAENSNGISLEFSRHASENFAPTAVGLLALEGIKPKAVHST